MPFTPLDPAVKSARDAEFDLIFRNHPPTSPDVGARMDGITDLTIEFAKRLDDLMPDDVGRYYDQVWVNLQQVSMWAKASLARGQD